MWIFTSNAFLSVVANRNDHSTLLVRARAKRHLQNAFPNAEIFEDNRADYRYRAFINRAVVSRMLADQAKNISYDNFKDSIQDEPLHEVATRVWGVMYQLQLAEGLAETI